MIINIILIKFYKPELLKCDYSPGTTGTINYMSYMGNHLCISESHEEMLERSESIRGWNKVESPIFAMMINLSEGCFYSSFFWLEFNPEHTQQITKDKSG